MRIAQVFAHAVVRRIAYVLVATALAWFGIGGASAQPANTCGIGSTCTKEQAYVMCMSLVTWYVSQSTNRRNPYCDTGNPGDVANGTWNGKLEARGTSTSPWGQGAYGQTQWHVPCPAGSVWNEDSKTCFNSQRCLDKSALGKGLISGTATSACIDGCAFAAPDGGTTLSFNGSNFITLSKGWEPTGAACSANAPTPNMDDPQMCKELGSGQTACAKQDGQECYKGAIGDPMQFCWKPGEVGDKNEKDTRQKRNAGETPIAPNLSLPSGDTLTQKGPPIVTQVTNNNTTTTTTTTNYTTQHGTDANGGGKPSDDGEPGDGSGEGEGEEGTASGGGDCESPPITTGDPVLGMVANQAWHTRCAVEAGNSAKVTGDVGDCAAPFSVEGTNANAHELRALRAQLCKGDANGDGQPDWTKPDGTEAGDGGEDEEPGILQRMVDTDLLDTGGFFGGGTCPQLGTIEMGPFGSYSFDSEPWFCDLVALMRGVVLLLGAFISLRILTGEGL